MDSRADKDCGITDDLTGAQKKILRGTGSYHIAELGWAMRDFWHAVFEEIARPILRLFERKIW